MRRYLASALILSSFSMFALVGCEDKAGTTVKETSTGPGGKTTTETSSEVKSTGSNPPANSAGETGKEAPK